MTRLRYQDHVVWITGASSGIGRALALELARQGARVAVSARRQAELEEVVRAIDALGSEGLAVPCDVTDESAVQIAVASVVEHFGRLDVAVANAGFGVVGKVEKIDAAAWRRQLDVNVIGAAMTARHALPALRQSRGRLVLVSSVSGMMASPGTGAYTASKYAVRALGQTLSMELRGSGVSCTTIAPGFVESNISRVDNAGHFDSSRPDTRPAALMWPTDKAARVMARAIWKRKREYVFTLHGKIGAFLGRHAPGLVHWIFAHGRA